MYTKQEIIIRYHREGISQRKISRDLGVSRKTVKKYIDGYSEAQQMSAVEELNGLCEDLSSPPKYPASKRPKRVLAQEVTEAIDELVKQNEEKRKQGLHKQLLKKCDMLTLLEAQGHILGYTTLCNYIRGKKDRPREAFVRQHYDPGSVCEFDWGEVVVFIKGVRTKLQMAVFTSAYSNYRFACLYHRQDTLSFMESHVAFFAHTKGVYHQMTYDNMRVVVSRFVGKHEKEPTQALINLKGHYQFHHRFCNAYKGNEKGHVERSVEYIRRKAFAFKDQFSTIEEANSYLCETVGQLNRSPRQKGAKTSLSLFEEENKSLWSWPGDFSCYSTEQARVDKYGTVSFCGNRYSVPDHLVGGFVDIKVFSNQLQLYYQDRQVASHLRSYGAHQWIISLGHFLDTLHKKPGALAHSQALLQSNDYLRGLYKRHYCTHPRSFIELLLYCRKHQVGWEKLQEVEAYLISLCPDQVSTDKFTAYLGNKQPAEGSAIDFDNQIELASKAHLKELADLI
jgi:transposase